MVSCSDVVSGSSHPPAKAQLAPSGNDFIEFGSPALGFGFRCRRDAARFGRMLIVCVRSRRYQWYFSRLPSGCR